MRAPLIKPDSAAYLLLRIGVAIAFIYPAVAAILDPLAWIRYFPDFLLDFAGEDEILMLYTFGAFEVILGVWILSEKRIFIPSVLATLVLAAIVIFNWNQIDVLFRDIPIALMSLALVFIQFQKEEPVYSES